MISLLPLFDMYKVRKYVPMMQAKDSDEMDKSKFVNFL